MYNMHLYILCIMKKAYVRGTLNHYILKQARINLSAYNSLKELFYINFRYIFNSKYPDYDIDMEDIRIRLQRKSFVNM